MQTSGKITMFPVQPCLWLSAKQCRTNVSKIILKKFCFHLQSGVGTHQSNHMVSVHICQTAWCRYTSVKPRGVGTHLSNHMVSVHICQTTWCRYTYVKPHGVGTHLSNHMVSVHTCQTAWRRYTYVKPHGVGTHLSNHMASVHMSNQMV